MLDGWTAEYGYRGFEGILINWLEMDDVGIRTRCHALDLAARGNYSVSADKLAEMVKVSLGRYGVDWDAESFDERVACLVCDNAADGVAAARELNVPCFRCLVHSTNLAVKEPDVLVGGFACCMLEVDLGCP